MPARKPGVPKKLFGPVPRAERTRGYPRTLPACLGLAFLLLLLQLTALPVLAVPPTPYSEYRALIGQAMREVDLARRQSDPACQDSLARIADILKGITAIQMPDNSIMTLGTCCGADSALRSEPCDPDRAYAFLRGLCPDCTMSTAALPPTDEDTTLPDDIAETLPDAPDTLPEEEEPAGEGELQRLLEQLGLKPPASGTTAPQGPPSGGQDGAGAGPLQGLWEQLGLSPGEEDGQDANDSGAEGEGETGEGGPARWPLWAWIVLAVVLLALGVGAYLLWRRHKKRQAQTAGEEEEDDVLPTADEAIEMAHAFVNQSDYRAAIRELFLATLLTLDDHGVIRYNSTLTNHELVNRIQSEPRLVSALDPVVLAFDWVWYGFQPLSHREYRSLVEQIESLKAYA